MKLTPERMADIIGDAILAAVEPLAARIAVLEARPVKGVEWAGVFTEDKIYQPGQLVTRGGSLWLCQRETAATPGYDPAFWKLVVQERR